MRPHASKTFTSAGVGMVAGVTVTGLESGVLPPLDSMKLEITGVGGNLGGGVRWRVVEGGVGFGVVEDLVSEKEFTLVLTPHPNSPGLNELSTSNNPGLLVVVVDGVVVAFVNLVFFFFFAVEIAVNNGLNVCTDTVDCFCVVVFVVGFGVVVVVVVVDVVVVEVVVDSFVVVEEVVDGVVETVVLGVVTLLVFTLKALVLLTRFSEAVELGETVFFVTCHQKMTDFDDDGSEDDVVLVAAGVERGVVGVDVVVVVVEEVELVVEGVVGGVVEGVVDNVVVVVVGFFVVVVVAVVVVLTVGGGRVVALSRNVSLK